MKKEFIHVIIAFLASFNLLGQTTQSILSIEYETQQIQGEFIEPDATLSHPELMLDSTMLNDPAMQGDPMVIQQKRDVTLHQNDVNGLVSVYINFGEVVGIKRVHYKIGRTFGASDLMNGFTNIDNYDMNNQVVFTLVDHQVKLDFGIFQNISHLYGEFQIEDNLGNRSTVFLKEHHL